MYRAVALCALLLTACGGGGGSSPAGGPLLPSPPPRTNTYFGFWYTEPNQLDQTTGPGKPTNIAFCQDDSPNLDYGESMLIQCAQEAQAHGVHAWIASIWPLLFNPQYQYQGPSALIPFCAQLQALNLMPTAFYILDEPDLKLASNTVPVLTQAAMDVRKVCNGPKIAAIFANKTDGKQALDWVGFDDGTNADELSKQPLLDAGQQYLLVAYGSRGASGWPMDPAPFVQFAATHAVAAVLAFAWATFGNMTGISVNGQAPAYLQAGCQITGLC